MTVTFPEPRYAVRHRPKGAKRWTTIVVCGSRAIATDTMFELMAANSGDWHVQELPTAAPPASAATREPIARPGSTSRE